MRPPAMKAGPSPVSPEPVPDAQRDHDTVQCRARQPEDRDPPPALGYAAGGETDWTWHEAAVPDRDTHFIAEANAFMDQVEGQPSRLCTVEAAAQTLRFNLAALASASTGGRVTCKDVHA